MDRKSRCFGLGDHRILIVASAVALVAMRGLWHGLTVEPEGRYLSVTPVP